MNKKLYQAPSFESEKLVSDFLMFSAQEVEMDAGEWLSNAFAGSDA